jgi:hypothetical protein
MFRIVRFYLLIFLFFNGIGIYAKEIRIEQVDFNYVMKKIVVNYNIVNFKPTERFQLKLFFITEFNDTIFPVSLTGDLNKIKGGTDKTITWDFFQDNAKINNVNIKAVVEIAYISDEPGGPSNALLSLLVPGLGDRYVSNPRKSIIKPYFVTILAYGFIGAGIFNGIEKSYYDYDKNHAVVPANIQNFNNKSEQEALYLYIYTGIGAAIWGTDIVYVLLKSKKKSDNKPKLSLMPIVNPCPNGFMALSLKILF